MYVLKQAALLAYENLKDCLKPHGYTPVSGTVGLWKHESRSTKFCLCVDDFGVKYFSKADANHLLQALQQHYKITVDWIGTNFCGLQLNWNYDNNYVDIAMPGYLEKNIETTPT